MRMCPREVVLTSTRLRHWAFPQKPNQQDRAPTDRTVGLVLFFVRVRLDRLTAQNLKSQRAFDGRVHWNGDIAIHDFAWRELVHPIRLVRLPV